MQKKFFYIAFIVFFGSASVIVSAQESRQIKESPGSLLEAHNADGAIEHAQTLPSREEKVEYLTEEAERFLGMNQYTEAERISSFVLTTYDPNNAQARRILERAQAESREKEEPGSLQNPSPEEEQELKQQMWDERTQNPVNLG